MPGPQTQHKGTVYGDDENAAETGTRPAGAPQTAYLLTLLLRYKLLFPDKTPVGVLLASTARSVSAERRDAGRVRHRTAAGR